MRTGVVLVLHGTYGRPLLQTAEELVGPLPLEVVEIRHDAGSAQARRLVVDAVGARDEGQGVLLLTDLWGSTLANVCLELLQEREGCELVTGVNLAMLLKLSTCDPGARPLVLAQELCRTAERSIHWGAEAAPKGEHGGD